MTPRRTLGRAGARLGLLALIALTAANSCRSAIGTSEAGLATENTNADLPVTVAPATRVTPLAPGAQVALAPIPEPLQLASPPAVAPLILSMTAEWVTAGRSVAGALAADGGQTLEVVTSPDPATELAEGRADLAVAEGTPGLELLRQPLLLAAAFGYAQDSLTAAEATAILLEGHESITPAAWRHLSPRQQLLLVDGQWPLAPGYPLQTIWRLQSAPGHEGAARSLAPLLAGAMATPAPVHLVAVGDIMLARAPGYWLSQGQIEHPFEHTRELLAAADITVGNVESAIGDSGQPAAKSYRFQAPPEAAAALALAGFDVVSLANNHALDFGQESLLQGIGLLAAAGVGVVGAGEDSATARAPLLLRVNDMDIAFLGYVNVPTEVTGFDTSSWQATNNSPGLAWATPEIVAADVAAAANEADVVVVVLHSGHEYEEQPAPEQQRLARAAVDAGASLVLGHHAHVIQGVEFYRDGVIVYGLGNFVFEIDGPPETAILNVWLDRRGVRQLQLVPALVERDGRPRLAGPAEARLIRQRFYQLSQLLGQ